MMGVVTNRRPVLSWLIGFFVLISVDGIAIDNGVEGEPIIECGESSIGFSVKTRNLFAGRIFVKGKTTDEECVRSDFARQSTTQPAFDLTFGICGMKGQRTEVPRGMYYYLTIIVSFHPMFVTKVDRAYHIKCFFEEAIQTITAGFDVSMLTTADVTAYRTQTGTCTYTIHESLSDTATSGDVGPSISFAQVGDKIVHRWECTDSMYSILVRNCYVSDGFGAEAEVIDENGCPTDPVLISGINYDSSLSSAYAESHVFKFADQPGVWFYCQIQMCLKMSQACAGLTPPNCASFPAPPPDSSSSGSVSGSASGSAGSSSGSSSSSSISTAATTSSTTTAVQRDFGLAETTTFPASLTDLYLTTATIDSLLLENRDALEERRNIAVNQMLNNVFTPDGQPSSSWIGTVPTQPPAEDVRMEYEDDYDQYPMEPETEPPSSPATTSTTTGTTTTTSTVTEPPTSAGTKPSRKGGKRKRTSPLYRTTPSIKLKPVGRAEVQQKSVLKRASDVVQQRPTSIPINLTVSIPAASASAALRDAPLNSAINIEDDETIADQSTIESFIYGDGELSNRLIIFDVDEKPPPSSVLRRAAGGNRSESIDYEEEEPNDYIRGAMSRDKSAADSRPLTSTGDGCVVSTQGLIIILTAFGSLSALLLLALIIVCFRYRPSSSSSSSAARTSTIAGSKLWLPDMESNAKGDQRRSRQDRSPSSSLSDVELPRLPRPNERRKHR